MSQKEQWTSTTPAEFYDKCSTAFLKNLLDHWEIGGERRREILDVLESRGEKGDYI